MIPYTCYREGWIVVFYVPWVVDFSKYVAKWEHFMRHSGQPLMVVCDHVLKAIKKGSISTRENKKQKKQS